MYTDNTDDTEKPLKSALFSVFSVSQKGLITVIPNEPEYFHFLRNTEYEIRNAPNNQKFINNLRAQNRFLDAPLRAWYHHLKPDFSTLALRVLSN